MAKYSIGLDYGTLSVRALLVDIESGEEVGISVFEYPHGVMDTKFLTGKKLPTNFALQHPQDYMDGLIHTITDVMKKSKVEPEDVIGIGIDFTSSTILPVKADVYGVCGMVKDGILPGYFAYEAGQSGGDIYAWYCGCIFGSYRIWQFD